MEALDIIGMGDEPNAVMDGLEYIHFDDGGRWRVGDGVVRVGTRTHCGRLM